MAFTSSKKSLEWLTELDMDPPALTEDAVMVFTAVDIFIFLTEQNNPSLFKVKLQGSVLAKIKLQESRH
jgi:hypothetical protein